VEAKCTWIALDLAIETVSVVSKTVQFFLCEKRSCKHKISESGVEMIHKLDIHNADVGTVVTEDLANTAIACKIKSISEAVLEHVSAVAQAAKVLKCTLSFRVCNATLYLHSSRAA
jgi:hypothetical protein